MKIFNVALIACSPFLAVQAEDDLFKPQSLTPENQITPQLILPSVSLEKNSTTHTISVKKLNLNAATPAIEAAAKRILKEHQISFDSKGVKTQLKLDATLTHDEEYKLLIEKDNITISAKTYQGMIWGLQTLNQLIDQQEVECCDISDFPKFPIRGLMHDVGRNFQNIELLKKQIDMMSRYKINVFHWHATDNPGWRFESKLYPEINSAESMTRQKGRFYTQDEYRDLVKYAKERGVLVIPEFDIPGHTAALRRALKIEKMNEPQVRKIIGDLIREFIAIVPNEDMPYIHLGTDEAKSIEHVPAEWLVEWTNIARDAGKKVITWNPGIRYGTDDNMVQQMWTGHAKPWKNRPYINSQNTYTNHMDMFELLPAFIYQDVHKHTNDECLGSILCVWHDDKVAEQMDVIRMNGVYPSLLIFSEFAWTGMPKRQTDYSPNLPSKSQKELLQRAVDIENKIIAHRNKYFAKESFPYVRQSDMEWRLIHFPNPQEISDLPSPENLKVAYNNDKVTWLPETYTGATIYPQHFWYPNNSPIPTGGGEVYGFTRIWSDKDQEVGAWIGFHSWSRSFGQRRGGQHPQLDQWSISGADVWVNNQRINPPKWATPGAKVNDEETPLIDQDYHYREPSKLSLKKGWNTVFIKCPRGKGLWKWVFTFAPVVATGDMNVKEVPNLKYSATFADESMEKAFIALCEENKNKKTVASGPSVVTYSFKDDKKGAFTDFNTTIGRFVASDKDAAEIQGDQLVLKGKTNRTASVALEFPEIEPVQVLEFDMNFGAGTGHLKIEKLVNGKWTTIWDTQTLKQVPTNALKFTLKEPELKGLRFSTHPKNDVNVLIKNLKLTLIK